MVTSVPPVNPCTSSSENGSPRWYSTTLICSILCNISGAGTSTCTNVNAIGFSLPFSYKFLSIRAVGREQWLSRPATRGRMRF